MLFRVEGMRGSKTYRCVEGRPAIHMANRDIIKLAKSVNKWAASVAIAKLLDQIPPEKSCKNDCSKRVVIVFMGMDKASPNAQHPSKFGGLSMLQLEFKRLQGNKLRTRSQRKSTHTQQQHWKGGVVGLSMRPIKCTQITFSHFTCRTSQRERRMTYRRCTHKGSTIGWWRARRNNTVLLQFATKTNDWHDITSQKGFSRQGERKMKFRTEKSNTIETRMPIPCHHSWDEQRQVVSMCVCAFERGYWCISNWNLEMILEALIWVDAMLMFHHRSTKWNVSFFRTLLVLLYTVLFLSLWSCFKACLFLFKSFGLTQWHKKNLLYWE